MGDSPLARAGKRATARDIAGIQAPNHRPSHAHPSTKWPLSSTPPSPRASPPPRCVSIPRGPLARASRARFRGGPRANIASRSSLPTSKPRVQNVSDPICRASPPSTARRRPPHLLRQGRRRPRPRAVRVTPDRSRARGPFPATVRDVICRGCVFRVGPRAGVPTAVVAEDPVRSPRRRSAPCGRVTPRPRHARGDARLWTHAPPSRAPTRVRTRGGARRSPFVTVHRSVDRRFVSCAARRVSLSRTPQPHSSILSPSPFPHPNTARRARLSPCARRPTTRRR